MVKKKKRAGKWSVSDHPKKTGNENKILLLVARHITSCKQPGQHNPKSSQMLVNILLRFQSHLCRCSTALISRNLGGPFEVSYRILRQNPRKHAFLLLQILIFAGAVLPPCGATSEKVEQNYLKSSETGLTPIIRVKGLRFPY